MLGDESGLFWETPIRVTAKRSMAEIFNVNGIKVESFWKAPTEYPELEGRIALDLETEDPEIDFGSAWPFPGRGDVVGFAVATADREWYFPFSHKHGQNLDREMTIRWMRDQLKKPTVEPIFANANYDMGWLKRLDITPAGRCHDVQIQATLLDENRLTYGLDALGKEFLGVGKDEELIRKAAQEAGVSNPKNVIHLLPPKYVGPYGEIDARRTYDLFHFFEKQIKEEGLERVYNIESRLIPLAMMMRWTGVRVDVDGAEQAREALKVKEAELIKQVKDRTTINVNAWDAGSIAKALLSEGIKLPLTATGKPSVTKQILASLDSPVAQAVKDIRRYNKARTTFIDGHVLGRSHLGRVHANFNQLRGGGEDGETAERGAIARFSSTDPNLQQIPSRDDEIKKLIRRLFVPEYDEKWASLDYSSQEPRLTVHFAVKAQIPGAEEIAQRYRESRKVDPHQIIADICGIERRDAKPINLGLAYGMGGAKLCRELGLPTKWMLKEGRQWKEIETEEELHFLRAQNKQCYEVAGEEGAAIIEKYHEGAPFMKGTMELAQRRAKTRGFIISILGRRQRFPFYPGSKDRIMVHAALNRLIQSSAADQTKSAMVHLWEENKVIPLVTVHDELAFSVTSEKQARYYGKVMEEIIPLEVPVLADIKMGDNWGELKTLEAA